MNFSCGAKAFWDGLSEDQAGVADRFAEKVSENRREFQKQVSRLGIVWLFCVIAYWLVAYEQVAEISIESVKIRNLRLLLHFLPLVIAVVYYRSCVCDMFAFTAQKFLITYYKKRLPSLVEGGFHELLNFPNSSTTELTLGNFGVVGKFSSIFYTLFYGVGLLLACNAVIAFTLFHSISTLDYSTWKFVKIGIWMLALIFWLRSVSLMREFFAREIPECIRETFTANNKK